MALQNIPMFRQAHELVLAFTDATVKRRMDYELGCVIGFGMSLVSTALGNAVSETGYAPEFRTLGFWTMWASFVFLGAGLVRRLLSRQPTTE